MNELMSSLTRKSRQFGRQELATDVKIWTDVTMDSPSNFYAGLTGNVSAGGLFVATDRLYPAGTFLQLQFRLPGSPDPIKTVGEVRWVAGGETAVSGTTGMGVRFLNLRDQDLALIEAFTKRRPTFFYDDED